MTPGQAAILKSGQLHYIPITTLRLSEKPIMSGFTSLSCFQKYSCPARSILAQISGIQYMRKDLKQEIINAIQYLQKHFST